MLRDSEFFAQLPDGRFVPSLGNPELLGGLPRVAACASELPSPEPDLTDDMSEIGRASFLVGLAYSRYMARWAEQQRHLHESKDGASPSSAQRAVAAKG